MEYLAPLTVIKPIVITDAMLTSHSVAETEATYDAGTSYSYGDVVKYGSDHDAFSSLVLGTSTNTGNTPVKWPDSTSYWYDEGKTNRWNMFDLTTNIQTSGTSPMTLTLEPGEPVTAIHFDTLECDTVDISISDGVSTVYTASLDARTRDVIDWYAFFYEQFRYRRVLSVYDLPGGVSNPVLTITFTSSTGTSKCGGLIIGKHYVLGNALNQSSHTRQGFSVFERDDVDPNRVRLLKRGAVKRLSVRAFMLKNRIDSAINILDDIDGIAASWSALQVNTNEWYGAFAGRFVYKSPVVIRPVENSNEAYLDIELEGI